MADQRRSSTSQMADLNAQLMAQNNQIKNMNKIAQQTNQVTTNIQGELYKQRGKIQNNIKLNQQIKHEVKKADKTTSQMRRRELCIKFSLWIVIVLLFALIVSLIIWKVTTKY